MNVPEKALDRFESSATASPNAEAEGLHANISNALSEYYKDLIFDSFHNYTSGLIILDTDYNILTCNTEFSCIWKNFGVPLIKSLTLIENLEAAAALGIKNNSAQILLDAIAEQGKFPSPFILHFANGLIYEFDCSSSGKSNTLIVTRDVTEHENRKAAIAQSEYRYRLLVETITEGLLVLDRQHRIAYANPRFLKIYGGAETNLLGHSLLSLIPEEARTSVEAILTGEEKAPKDVPLVCYDGSICFVLISTAPFTDEHGETSGNFATITDITELRRASEMQKQSETRFRNIIENTPFGILTLDVNGQILSANPAFCNMIDSRTHAIALSAAQQWLPEMSPPLSELMALLDAKTQTATSTGEPGQAVTAKSRMLISNKAKNKKLGYARLVLSKIGDIGESYLMVVEDISEHHAMEEALQHASKLALLGEMSASMAHEISQPLNIIRLAAENAINTLGGNCEKYPNCHSKIQSTLENISAQSNRLRETVNHMQAFSRRDTGPQRSFDVMKTLQDALIMLQPRCAALGINITQYLPETSAEAPITVMGHPRHMEQVLLNLLHNAADAIVERRLTTPNDTDEILISARLESHGARDVGTGERLIIEVSDSGTGIRPEDMSHLFDPFFTRKKENSGTGLGLSISLGLMGNMGGHISAENRPEGGCCFKVTVPTTKVPIAPPNDGVKIVQGTVSSPTPQITTCLSILLVDDEPLVLREMAEFLKRSGHRVIQAGGGDEAKQQLQSMHIDVVITDLQMPNGNGYDLIDHISNEYPHLGVIITTGQPLRDRMAVAELENGADAILHKPVSLKELTETLQRLA